MGVALVAAAVLAAPAAEAAPADMYVYLAGGEEKKTETVTGDERYTVHLVTGRFAWPPADCTGVCVTFESFEKSARRTGTLMRVCTKEGNFRRDREVDFLPQISTDAVKDHLDSLLIIVHSILHEVTIPSAEVVLPTPPPGAPGKSADQPSDTPKSKTSQKTAGAAKPEGPKAIAEADENVSAVAKEKARIKAKANEKEPQRPAFSFPLAITVGTDWVTDSLMAPTLGLDVGARLPLTLAVSLGYRSRFAASYTVGTSTVSTTGQRYSVGVGTYLPRYRRLDVGVFLTPEIESLEVTSGTGTTRHDNLFLIGGELRFLYHAQRDLGVFVSVGAQYATNRIRVEFQEDGSTWETGSVSTGVHGGLFYEFAL